MTGACFLTNVILHATIIHVPQDQPIIQAGIDIAIDGDTVLVDTGTYVENIKFNGKNIVVGSLLLTTGDASYILQTVIDGDSNGTVVTFESGEDSSAMLIGFTVTNGYDTYGGGIKCRDNSNPILKNLVVIHNVAYWVGGGIYIGDSNPILTKITVSDNTAVEMALGGGIYLYNSSATLTNISVSENYAHHNGAGIYCESSNPKLNQVIISQNYARSHADGLFCNNSNPALMNVIIYGNGYGIGCFENSNLVLINTILWNDSPQEIYFSQYGAPNSITITYSDVAGGLDSIITNNNGTINWLEGNINSDPLFVDAENDDFHLQESSPCIDAGTPFFVWEGDTLVDLTSEEYAGSAPDIGVFESLYTAGIAEGGVLPEQLALHQNYPNPFNPATTIRFALPHAGEVDLIVYDILGREVETLVSGKLVSGIHEFVWDASEAASGIYLYRLTLEQGIRMRKLVVIK